MRLVLVPTTHTHAHTHTQHHTPLRSKYSYPILHPMHHKNMNGVLRTAPAPPELLLLPNMHEYFLVARRRPHFFRLPSCLQPHHADSSVPRPPAPPKGGLICAATFFFFRNARPPALRAARPGPERSSSCRHSPRPLPRPCPRPETPSDRAVVSSVGAVFVFFSLLFLFALVFSPEGQSPCRRPPGVCVFFFYSARARAPSWSS